MTWAWLALVGERPAGAAAAAAFGRLLPARRLDVGAGVLGVVPPPAGPTIERYGSANPWPRDAF